MPTSLKYTSSFSKELENLHSIECPQVKPSPPPKITELSREFTALSKYKIFEGQDFIVFFRDLG